MFYGNIIVLNWLDLKHGKKRKSKDNFQVVTNGINTMKLSLTLIDLSITFKQSVSKTLQSDWSIRRPETGLSDFKLQIGGIDGLKVHPGFVK